MGTTKRVILGGLALLWAGVLPWLCWGAWGQPGHPHAAPHWVFAPPPAPAHVYAAPDPVAHAHVHTHTHSHDPAPGPARPDTLLVALLLVVWPAAWVIPLGRRLTRGRRAASLYVGGVWQRIPTPPPRPLLCGLVQAASRADCAPYTSL